MLGDRGLLECDDGIPNNVPDIPVARVFSRLFADLDVDSRVVKQPVWKPSLAMRELAFAKLKARERELLKKKRCREKALKEQSKKGLDLPAAKLGEKRKKTYSDSSLPDVRTCKTRRVVQKVSDQVSTGMLPETKKLKACEAKSAVALPSVIQEDGVVLIDLLPKKKSGGQKKSLTALSPTKTTRVVKTGSSLLHGALPSVIQEGMPVVVDLLPKKKRGRPEKSLTDLSTNKTRRVVGTVAVQVTSDFTLMGSSNKTDDSLLGVIHAVSPPKKKPYMTARRKNMGFEGIPEALLVAQAPRKRKRANRPANTSKCSKIVKKGALPSVIQEGVPVVVDLLPEKKCGRPKKSLNDLSPNKTRRVVKTVAVQIAADLALMGSSGETGNSLLGVIDAVSPKKKKPYMTARRQKMGFEGIPEALVVAQTPRKRKRANKPANTSKCSKIVKKALANKPLASDVEMFMTLADVAASTWVLSDVPDCLYCGALRFAGEPPGFCCASGKVSVPLPTMPEPLWNLFVNDVSPMGVEFRRLSRTYNNTMSFTSICVHYDTDLANGRAGVYTFRIQGMIRHLIPDLVPADGMPVGLQLYFYDTQQEMSNRIAQASHLSADIIARLLQILEQNPYARFFRSMVNVPALADYTIVLRGNPQGLDRNVYNLPTVDQVAAIWNEGAGSALAQPTDIRVNLHGGESSFIHYYYGCYDPLQYVLLFPDGTPGWRAGLPLNSKGAAMVMDDDELDLARHIDPDLHDDPGALLEAELENLRANGRKRSCVAMRSFYCYWFQLRRKDRTNILKTGRLIQQFQIDVYVKIETQRLDYLRFHQSGFEMRAESYGNLVQRMAASEFNARSIGQRVYLSPTFTGGPRDVRRRFMNALAVVAEKGRPDLFITMTCNSAWTEIQDRLGPNELAQNRADLEARVFRAKLMEMKQDLIHNSLFGKVAGYFYVVEFQKRGLPHVHWLLILKPRYKITTTEAYDRVVSAEIPDPKTNPHLYNCVVKHMMHGPCGDLNRKNVCMVQGKCKNYYPKPFQPKTEHCKDSYPNYMRRQNGVTAVVRGKELDNRWVVPYNPYLLAKYDCHINVQICNDIKGVKYLYKYCCKGNDQTAFNIVESDSPELIDEIANFQKSRWLCAPEAMWRIYAFDLFEMSPPVCQLHVHLPGYQLVYYTTGQSVPKILDRERVGKTQLTEFFTLNRENPEARAMNMLYSEVCKYFVWVQTKRYWKVRCGEPLIGRLVTVSIAEVDRFYLRLLLNHVRAPECYEDLLRFKGKMYISFREAALARGLLEDDDDLRKAMQQAVVFQFPMVLRTYFAMILVYNSPSDPRKLWEEFKQYLSEDMIRHCDGNDEEGYKAALRNLDICLRTMGKEIGPYQLVDYPSGLTEVEVATREYASEINVQIDPDDLLSAANLNPAQKHAFETILASLPRTDNCAYFIDGPGGSGKTFLYKALLAKVRSTGAIALAVASSGVAASLMPNGRTAHSRFQIPLDLDESQICQVSKSTAEGRVIIASKLILWDEISMTDKRAIEAVNMLLQDLMENKLFCGGKTVVFGGDLRQTAPIIKRGSREDIVDACLVNSTFWPGIQKLHLTHNMRAQEDPVFAEYLLRVGGGTEPCVRDDVITLPETNCLPFYTEDNPINGLIAHVFPSLTQSVPMLGCEVNSAILTPKNDSVSEINDMIIDMFPGDSMEYISTDYANNPADQAYHQDFMNAVEIGGFPPHVLRLKKNCPVMLLRNLSPTEGLCNGTRLIITALSDRCIQAVIAVGARKGQPVLIPRIPLECDDMSKCPVIFKRHQYPIKLCFAMTINKSQGQTLERVGVYLPEPTFSHGQLYVALSRVRTQHAIKFLIRPPLADAEATRETRNVVFKEILRTGALGSV